MGKLPYGVANRHVKTSHGADTDLMKFYSTTNSTTYGRQFSKFEPRRGRHTGTGYLSNFRPGVYYSGRLDQLDNPKMGQLLKDNYESVTEKCFQPSQGPNGCEPLPDQTYQAGSGFVRQKPVNIPTQAQVQGVCIDTRVASAPAAVMPRHKPHLHKIIAKDPVELENAGYGPGYMTTENHVQFKGEQPGRPDVTRKSVGGKEGSGFTHAYNVEPISFHPDYAHKGEWPGYMTGRPTGHSIQTTDYRPAAFSMGKEPLPSLANRSVRDTGFTTGTKAHPVYLHRVMADAYDKAGDIPNPQLDRIRKADPAEYLNTVEPNNHSSIATNIFQGQQQPSRSETDRLSRTAVGYKELTGYCENNDRFIQTSDNPSRFITHYMTKFLDRNPEGKDREGHTWGSVQRQKADGFTKSSRVHDFAEDRNSTAILRNLEPYVARSIKARDPFFDDHTHDGKLYAQQKTMVGASA